MIRSKSNAIRSIFIAVAVIFMFVSIMACTETVSAASKLKVSVSKKTVYVGQTVKLTANKNVKWSVSKEKIAKLTNAKKKTVTVKGLKAGTVYITAKAGKSSKKIKLVVVKRIPLKIYKNTIGIGEQCGVFIDKEKTSIKSSDVTFSSSDESVAIVSGTGLITGTGKGTATITANSKTGAKGEIKITVVATRAGTITVDLDLSDESRYPAGKVAKVWVPIPKTDDHQSINTVLLDGKAAKLSDVPGGKVLYIEWDANTKPEGRKATVTYHIYRKAIDRDKNLASKESGTVDDADKAVKEELNPTMWSGSPTSGIVKEIADEIVAEAGATTVYDKAHAIYNWVCDNITRIDDKTVLFGDVEEMLAKTRDPNTGRDAGSCMDMNSVFVSLCRAEGIPARNLFGMRFTNDKNPSQKPGPNCRAEFYLPGYGWVTADPALAMRQIMGKEDEYIGSGAKYAADWELIKDNYWGSGEENWICLNTGRDIWLTPNQTAKPAAGEKYLEILNTDGSINLFMFPYGEFDGKYIPCQDAANFHYEYSYKYEDPLDCGC